jgi:spermidine synthase
VESVTVVEIDRMVTDVIMDHFESLRTGLSDPRVSVVYEDGQGFLAKGDQAFDVIIVDAYDPGGPVQSLTAEPFFPLVAERLTSDGVAVFQTDSPTLASDTIRTTVRNVSALFAQYRPYTCALPSFPEGICSFVAAARREGGLDAFDEERYGPVADGCRCYNRHMHTAAFMLPRFIGDALLG